MLQMYLKTAYLQLASNLNIDNSPKLSYGMLKVIFHQLLLILKNY